MRGQFKALTLAGVMLAAGLGTVASASAATTPPLSINTSTYACTNGVCSLGLGNVGMRFEADLFGEGGANSAEEPYAWSLVSGSLPAGLELDGPTVFGTPTKAGTSSFTLKVTDTDGGASVSQAFTITVGTGNLDHIIITQAGYIIEGEKLVVEAVDANAAATLTVSVTSDGKQVGTLSTFGSGMFSGTFFGPDGTMTPQEITVTSSVGGSTTSAVTVAAKQHY